MRTLLAASAACLAASALMLSAAEVENLSAVPFTSVQFEDEFWGPRLKVVAERTLPHCFEECEQTGRIGNFERAAGKKQGPYEGYYFNDSDVYKVIEGAAYILQQQHDAKLDEYLDALIAKIAAAQQPDGYLNSYFSLTPSEPRWTNLKDKHELYCAGHLIEAAIAHNLATGKRNLLDVALRNANHIAQQFGPLFTQKTGPSGHEEIELALLKLANLTGEARWADLAHFFLEQRGRHENRETYGDYAQDHLPIREQKEIAGHAVRAMYLYTAMAESCRRSPDDGMLAAMDSIWTDLTRRKLYVTGGVGPSAHNEGFTVAFDLPNDTAYAETCAGIGLIFWAHRLNLLYADARYFDMLERVLFNNTLSAISLDGTRYFYENRLASRGQHHRQPWFSCACCPPNLVRLLPTIGGYMYAQKNRAVYLNLYARSRTTLYVEDRTAARQERETIKVELAQDTRYPWDGRVRITVTPASPVTFDLFLRIPGWCTQPPTISIDGTAVDAVERVRGYARVSRTWDKTTTVELDLPTPIERIEADPRVRSTTARVALQRGPLVYCLEAVDHGGRVRNIALPPGAELTAVHRADVLGGVTVLTGPALAVADQETPDSLYHPARSAAPCTLTATPYYAWDNREPGEMTIWIPETPALVERPPIAWLRPSASHRSRADTLAALHDRTEPESSHDTNIPRFTWWPRRGTEEWVQYDFDKPRQVSAVAVYWFDDTPRGGACSTPLHWRLQYRRGEEWIDVERENDFGTQRDTFNRVSFAPITTDALRITAQLQSERSGGILEWRVEESR